MSTLTKNLLFFDKEGYPYNLNYDLDTNEWSGKIYFDENSSDTFKTVCLYIFEKVLPFTINNVFDLRASQLFNYSGMTFIPSTFTGQTITDIKKVNSSDRFYSKWIKGDNFDRKFPVGTVVWFDGVTGSTTIDLCNPSGVTYYNVLGTQKDAFLITTLDNNGSFDFVFSGGTVSSLNVIKTPDYANQKLVDVNNLNYYTDKKISVVGSEDNDGVYTYSDYNILKTKVYDFNLSGETGGTISLGFYLMTQRPELYEGNIKIYFNGGLNDLTGTTIEFYNYINTNVDFTTTGQTIIFEQPDGSGIDSTSNPEFTITGFIDRETITTYPMKFYYNEEISVIESASGITGLNYNDYIELIALPNLSGETFHDRRQFQVLNVTDNKIQVREYIIQESGYTYRIDKIIKKNKVQKLYCTRTGIDQTLTPTFSGYTICYSTSNYISMSQEIINSGSTSYYYENTISAMRNKYKNLLDRYGLNLYHYNYSGYNYLMFEGIDYNYQPYYSGATTYINSTLLNIDNNFTYLSGGTIMDSDVYYFSVNEKIPKYERVYHYDYSNLAKNFYVEIYFNIERDIIDYGFNLNLNYVDYFINISGSTGTYSQNTINYFIEKYSSVLDKNGISIYSGYTYDGYTGYTLIIEGQQPNIELYDAEVRVNSYSNYAFIEKTHNHSIVIDSSELYLVDGSLYDYELSTGMVIDVCGCTHTLNNKQYNILRITPDIIQLSYQGPFLYEYNVPLTISVNEFIRSPRGNYDKDIYYKFSWVPIEGNDPQISNDIFYYDYSGNQLQSNGDLTYTGQKPLWNSSTENLVFLNKEPNKNIENVTNPEYQQTVFESLTYTLDRLNSSQNYDYRPIPLQVYVGFNSVNEGVSTNIMKLEKIEYIIFSGTTDPNSGNTTYNYFLITGSTHSTDIFYITSDPNFDFNLLGFEVDQHISLSFLEDTVTGHTIYGDYKICTIKDITKKRITVEEDIEFFDSSLSGKTYDFVIKTEPDTLATIYLYGQTEIEDERFVQHLKMIGANLESEVQPIFKESDINEVGIDYTILNRKRKELLSIYPEIYNYIGSYKALINAINFFGYNDLDLYEYYRCIKPNSPLYGKLQRVYIEDIFINTIPGWEEPELDSVNYLKTNLFNLTYKITDFEGNYIEMYSLAEVQTKLTKLVYWLRRNVVPLSSNILDITGMAHTRGTLYINYDASNYVKKITVNQECSVINFNHIQTLNIDSNYLFTINFYLTSGSTMPKYWTAKVKTFHLNETTRELEPVQYHQLYKTDMLSYSFNVDKYIDPYMYIETQTYNDYGLGYTNSKLFNYNEGRNFVLVNNNFSGVNYKYLTDNYGFYIITDGRYYIIKY